MSNKKTAQITDAKFLTVNHPPHYTKGKIECIDAIDTVTENLKGEHGYYTGTILKYIWRWYHKNGIEDLRKAQWYLERLIAKLEHPDREGKNGTR